MIYFTELENLPVFDVKGEYLGRLFDLGVNPSQNGLRVATYLVRAPKKKMLCITHEQVQSISVRSVQTRVPADQLRDFSPDEGLLRIKKDVLDQQVINVDNRKVVRVNDVEVADSRVNGNTELRLTQVDVGLPGAVRRLLQGVVPPMGIRRIQQKLPKRTILWEFVNLIEPDPLRRVKLRMSSAKLAELHPADLADIMEEISPTERQSIIDSLDEETAAETIAELDKRLQTQVVEQLDPEKAADIIEEMNPDEAVDLMQRLEPAKSEEVLEEMEHREAAEVKQLMKFEENTAGGMMNTEIVVVGEDATRGEVVDYIRFHEISLDQLDNVVLINREAALAGTVPVARLILAGGEQRMAELAFEPLVSIKPDASDKEVFEIFDKYNLRSLAVVNEQNVPVGAITVDDVVSRMRAQL